MDKQKRRALVEAAGFRFGDAADFLECANEQRRAIEHRSAKRAKPKGTGKAARSSKRPNA